jgi:tetratricopeptide (TPR) repeat protein
MWIMVDQARDESLALYNKGREAMERSDLRAAVDLFQQSIDLLPHFKTLELQGECLLKLEQPTKVIIALSASATLGSRPFRALYLLAQALLLIGEKRKAIEKLKEALAMQPEFAGAKRLLATLGSDVSL